MGPYTIIRKIGSGGMGDVHEGINGSGKRVAIKMMRSSLTMYPEFRALFYSEAATLAKLDHPSVVHIDGEPYKDQDGNLYLPMEFVEGVTLEQHIRHYRPFTEAEAKDLMSKILPVMAYIHRSGCIHRDIKPANIMLRPDSSICIIDFGIAKDVRFSTGKTIGTIIGTDGYMSPEQADGNSIDYRTDIYSLGCLFFYLMTGEDAFPKNVGNSEMINTILNVPFPDVRNYNSHVSERTAAIIFKATDKNMMLRFQSADEFREALDSASNSSVTRVTVGRADCDIVIPNEFVSTHHADLEYDANFVITDGFPGKSIFFKDRSRNATSINGRRISNETVRIRISPDSFPEIYLAGLDSCRLTREAVVRAFERKGVYLDGSPMPPPPPTKPVEPELGVGLSILCFLAPLVGWILWAVWREETPLRARKASLIAWAGLAVNIFLNVIFAFLVS